MQFTAVWSNVVRMRTLLPLLALAACGPEKEDYTKQKPVEETRAETPPPAVKKPERKVLTEAELGTCHLTASGAVTADQTTPGGRAATNVSYWLSDEERKNMMGAFGKATLAAVNGSVDVTAFDSHHIAGTVDLEGTLAPGGGKVKIAGN